MKYILILFCVLSFSACQRHKNEPIYKNGLYSFKSGEVIMTINPYLGARISSLTLKGKEMLGPEGSTFWTSPQETWGWPPLKAHHEGLYNVIRDGETLTFLSHKDSLTHAVIKKKIKVNEKENGFIIIYSILNEGNAVLKVAPWENTRTPKTSLTFYPAGAEVAQGPFGKLKLSESFKIMWFGYAPERILNGTGGKLFADGTEGWIANVNPGTMLIKKFKDIGPNEAAPNEAEIEVYADVENPFIEVEQQGAYKSLKPGEQMDWQVEWIIKEIPSDIEIKEGNKALVDLARNLVK